MTHPLSFTRYLTARTFLVTLLALGSVATAAEITLYEHGRFGGRAVTLRGFSPNLAAFGFNNVASSMVVSSGSWQLCTKPDFQGTCETFNPGEYRDLPPAFNDRFSSAREMASHSQSSEYSYGNQYQRGSVELYERGDFQGNSITLDKNIGNFDQVGFNDRAVSIIVNEGTWEFCEHADFRGSCRRYAPGRYGSMGPGMVRAVSSGRMISTVSDAPVIVENPRVTGEVLNSGRAVLFGDEGLRGGSFTVGDAIANLERHGFNDQAASIWIEAGYWELCGDANFRGQCQVLSPGQYRRLPPQLSRNLSSLRPVASASPASAGRPSAPRVMVELFNAQEMRGDRLPMSADMNNLEMASYNDRAASMIVYEGVWELCEHANFRGRCVAFGPGRYSSLNNMNDEVSSLRRIR